MFVLVHLLFHAICMGATSSQPRILNAEMFRIGSYEQPDGSIAEFSQSDIDEIVANWELWQSVDPPSHSAPVTPGHNPPPGTPALAWVDKNVLRDGPLLFGDFKDVTDQFAEDIQSGAYKTLSAEIYQDVSDPINGPLPGKGKGLRAVAALGSDIPRVKGMKPIPVPTYSENKSKILYCFSEFKGYVMQPMTKDDAVAYLTANMPGVPLDGVPDAFLIAVAQSMVEGETPADEDADAKLSEPKPVITPAVTPPAVPPMPSTVTLKYAEGVTAKLKAHEALLDQLALVNKTELVNKFCEEMIRAPHGKLLPAQVPAVKSRLLRADCVARVHTFAEGSKQVTGSELDAQMAEIRNGPTISSFAERIRQPGITVVPELDSLEEQTKKFAASRPKYARK